MVASVHSADLGEGYMALINEGDEILREVVYQAERPLAGLAAVKVAGVVLYARAVSHLLYHFKVVLYTLLQSLGFDGLAYILEISHLLDKVVLDFGYRSDGTFAVGHEVIRGINVNTIQSFNAGSSNGIYQADGIYLISEEFYPHSLVGTSQENIHRVTPYSEGPALEVGLGTGVQALD